jgi:hypothetical protein
MSLSDLKKSVESVFTERISSPFYGTFILSWVIWNWQPIYLTVFVDQRLIAPKTKLEYIVQNYANWWHLLILPLVSTAFLIGIVPWAVNKALKIHLNYEKERISMRESIDAGKRLTIEQTAEIRNQMSELSDEHEKQVRRKDDELKICKAQIRQLETDKVAFKVNKAMYGIEGSWKDVTEIVNNLLLQTEGQRLLVENEILGGDPLHGTPKLLVISYKWNNVSDTVVAKEHYIVFLKDSHIKVEETVEAIRIYNEIEEANKQRITTNLVEPLLLETFFPGTWKLVYKGELNGEEFVRILEGNKYWVKDIPTNVYFESFTLKDVSISIPDKEIKFTKVRPDPSAPTTSSTLKIIELGKKYVGVEEDARVSVDYMRID